MAKLPENPKDITHLIWQAYEAKAEGLRDYLGMSQIGDPCARKLWYYFRHAGQVSFGGRILALFERGHEEEPRINKKLRMIGVRVVEFDDDGKQFEFIGHKGHAKGHMDSALINIPEAVKTWHVGEYKTHSDKSFQDVKKNGVEKSKPVHWAQMQKYMGHSGMERALYVAINKNDDDIYTERVHFDRKAFDDLCAKEAYIIDAQEPPERLSNDPSWYLCRMCDYHEVCHLQAAPQANCRTCARSTPVDDGKWSCEKHVNAIALCADHLYIPALLGQASDGSDEYVMYEGFINATHDAAEGSAFEGHHVYTSKQIEAVGNVALLKDGNVKNIVEVFDAPF